MFEKLVAGVAGVREALGEIAAAFDPDVVAVADAERFLGEVIAIEAVAAHLKALAAARLAAAGAWDHQGDRSPAHHLARRCGSSVAKARAALATAERMSEQPELDGAARRGGLSPDQTAAIAAAGAADPGSIAPLVALAPRASLSELQQACEKVIAAADPDPDSRRRRIHAQRFARRRRGSDGSAHIHYRSTPEDVATVWAVISGYAARAFADAEGQGRRQSAEAFAADGMLAMAEAAAAHHRQPGDASVASRPQSAVPTKIVVRIDWDALLRGYPTQGEVCEIAGLGSVAVSAVRDMIATGDPFLAAVVTRGHDVATVAHPGRKPTAYQRSALDWLQPDCSALGCSAAAFFEIDHRADWADTRITLLALLDRYCKHHHRLKTHHGWALVPGTGKRPMVPPDHPDHPDHDDHFGQRGRGREQERHHDAASVA